jgi:hypothetical protein
MHGGGGSRRICNNRKLPLPQAGSRMVTWAKPLGVVAVDRGRTLTLPSPLKRERGLSTAGGGVLAAGRWALASGRTCTCFFLNRILGQSWSHSSAEDRGQDPHPTLSLRKERD